ncbi:MAG: type II secretion system F family protein [Planctomycetes bacterium]|nr:type II secretion system F family protein [Planctomycetota bacterium]
MTRYSFIAREPGGRTERGTTESRSVEAVVDELRGRGWVTLEVIPLDTGDRPSRRGREAPRRMFARAPRSVDVELSLQQIACMLRSELTLLSALRTCSTQSSSRSMRRVWSDVAAHIQEGGALSSGLAEHRCFSRMVVTMVAVGEETGEIESVLDRAASSMERRRHLRTGVLTALFYPILVILMAVGVVSYMMLGVIPRLQTFLASSGRQLPPITQSLLDVSNFVRAHALHGAIACAAGGVALAALYSWPPARARVDRAVLALPIVGAVVRLSATAMFARSISVLLASGVRLTEALRVVERLFRNVTITRGIARSRARVLQGGVLSEPLAECTGFYPMLASMAAVGESAGTLDEVLEQVAVFHESRLEALIRRLSVIVEPVITIVLGGIVGFVYLAFFMAIYSITGK